jgi:uncharacterized protein YndB with AHSA1/START domain
MKPTSIERDLDNRTLTIRRRFDAPRSRVWRAYTEPELLDQWWAPKPWKTETVRMDFRVGGHWLYTMNGPEGEQHFCRMDFLEIEPGRRFLTDDVFADESGATNAEMPQQQFDTVFSEEGETTLVTVVSRYPSVEDLKKVIEMGIEQGVTMAQDQLAELLASGGA